MSANINVTNPDKKKRILLVAANAATSPTTGWPVGFWWSELTHPYWSFCEVGYDVEIRSPEGGTLQADGSSDPEDDSGYSAEDIVTLGFKKSPRHMALIEDTKPLVDIHVDSYDAIFVAGGLSPMVTFRGNEKLQRLVARFYEAGKITALVCHGTCLLLETKLSDGSLLAKGKTWTGFSDNEEKYLEEYIGQRVQPFWIEKEARKIEGTNFVAEQMFREYAVRDGRLVTGQQQYSGAAAARLVIEALGH